MARVVKKFEDRKGEIIQAASHLFETQGYENTSMQELIQTIGIAKGTLYHYFESKEDLLEAVIEHISHQSIEQMKAVVQQARGNALHKIELLLKTGSIAAAHQNLLDSLHKPGNQEMHIRLLAAILTQQAPLYANLIAQGCNEGIFTTDSPLECAEFILSAVQFLTDRGIYLWSQEDLNRRIQAFPKIIEQLLAAPAGSFQFLRKLIK
jgi:AcrR family transcriptional regulator